MLTDAQIKFLNEVVEDEKWVLTANGVNVLSNVRIRYKITEIPVKFNRVTGYFSCDNTGLTTLKNGPVYVGKYFSCYNNRLKDLSYGPKYVGKYYDCSKNCLTTLVSPLSVCEGDFYCSYNKFTSLAGCPKINGKLTIPNNVIYYFGLNNVKTIIWPNDYMESNSVINSIIVKNSIANISEFVLFIINSKYYHVDILYDMCKNGNIHNIPDLFFKSLKNKIFNI